MEFRKKYKMMLADYIAFNLFNFKKRLVIYPLLTFLVTVIILRLYLFAKNYEGIVIDIISIIIPIILIALFAVVNILILRFTAKKQYLSSKPMQVENELVINDTGVHESCEYGSTNIKWPDIYKTAESKHAIIIFFSKMQAFVIPKRYITIEDDSTIRTLLKNNLSQEKYHLKN